MAGNHFQLLHGALLRNNRVQANSSGNACLPRERRIDRRNLIDERSLSDRATLTDTGYIRLRRRRATTSTADYAAKNAAHASTGNAAWNAALHTHGSGIGL